MGILSSIISQIRHKTIYIHNKAFWPNSPDKLDTFLRKEILNAFKRLDTPIAPPPGPTMEAYFNSLNCQPGESPEATTTNLAIFASIISALVLENIRNNQYNPMFLEQCTQQAVAILASLNSHACSVHGIALQNEVLAKIFYNQRLSDAVTNLQPPSLNSLPSNEDRQEKTPSLPPNGADVLWNEPDSRNPEQLKRRQRASLTNPISINRSEKTGIFRGSRGERYSVSLKSCSCYDFVLQHRTCKHMYRLADELRDHENSDVVACPDRKEEAQVSRHEAIDINDLTESLPGDYDLLEKYANESGIIVKEKQDDIDVRAVQREEVPLSNHPSVPVATLSRPAVQNTATPRPDKGIGCVALLLLVIIVNIVGYAIGLPGVLGVITIVLFGKKPLKSAFPALWVIPYGIALLFLIGIPFAVYGEIRARDDRYAQIRNNPKKQQAEPRKVAAKPKPEQSRAHTNNKTESQKSVFEAARDWTPKQSKDAKAKPDALVRTPTQPASPSAFGEVRHINIGGTSIAVPIPSGFRSEPGFPQTVSAPDVGPVTFHFMYAKDFLKTATKTSVGISTINGLDAIFLGKNQFQDIKKKAHNTLRQRMESEYASVPTGSFGKPEQFEFFTESDHSICSYYQVTASANGINVYSYNVEMNILVKGVMLIANHGVMTDQPRTNIPVQVKRSAIIWRDAILAANQD